MFPYNIRHARKEVIDMPGRVGAFPLQHKPQPQSNRLPHLISSCLVWEACIPQWRLSSSSLRWWGREVLGWHMVTGTPLLHLCGDIIIIS